MQSKYFLIALLTIAFLFSCCRQADRQAQQMPTAQREFRAAWVATVANIDWPSKPGLSSAEQQREALAILDTAQLLNLNAIIFQARPQCDALYPSALEPWSYYLTGVQGQAPEPFYDPLAFWIEEAHNRGLELHVWFNPYRVHHPRGGPITDASIVMTKPQIVRQLDNGYYWMDPGEKETQAHSFDVVMDVLRRYDIDGIHFDDYFYPYGDGSFPDSASWSQYHGRLSREDWRRDNVNKFIHKLYRAIKFEKPWVKFGLSPFGIWRPGNPPSIQGFDQYSILYADARLWLNKGWVDYWTPQLYWPISQIPQSYPILLSWWVQENNKNRHLWPGLFTSRAREQGAQENINQIMVERAFVPNGPGNVHFSMRALQQNYDSIFVSLKNGPYRNPALVPSSPWLDRTAPTAPRFTTTTIGDSIHISWTHDKPEDVFRWVLYTQTDNRWNYLIFNRNDRETLLPRWVLPTPSGRRRNPQAPADTTRHYVSKVALSAVDHTGNESKQTALEFEIPTE
jgi:uncharacterized lipoprotein YddW (UPF0748 family)